MKFFFNLKHWQIFIFVAGLLILPMFTPFLFLNSDTHPFAVIRWTMPLWMVSTLGYFLGFGYFLSKLSNRNKGFSYYLFLFLITFSIIYSTLFASFMFRDHSADTLGGLNFGYILPLHFFSMIGNLIVLRYCAKLINSIEKKREVEASDYLGDFFLLWFIPIGVWILQPRLTKIWEAHENK